MKNSHRFILLSFLAILLLIVGASTVQAQTAKIGFVNDEEIKNNYKAWQRAQEEWEVERKAWDEEASNRQTELDELIDEYEKQKLILSDEKKKEKEAAIRAKQEALDIYTRQIYGPGGTAEKKQETLVGPLLENVNKAIETVALENGYDVIFTLQSGLGYINPAFEVTDKVLEALENLE
ncbi:MAG: OmpH family outer membrane protein [Candidatus Zixiibacteriota bacterium]